MVESTKRQILAADAVIVLGSSLMVWSSYRLAKLAVDNNKPLCIVNIGATRADPLATVKVEGLCSDVLPLIVKCTSSKEV